jgi:hypothetical protein
MAQMTTNEVTMATFLVIEGLFSTAYFLYDFRLSCKKKIQNETQTEGKGDNGLIFFEI